MKMTEENHPSNPDSVDSSKQALLAKIEDGFNALMRVSESLDDRTMLANVGEGEWSVKDHLAHIAAWEEILLHFHIGGEPFETVIGVPGALYRVTSYDLLNEHLHRRHKDLTSGEVIARLKAGHEAVMGALDRMTEDELAQPRAWLDTPEAPSGPMAQYIARNTYEHYAEHLATIQHLVVLD
jgi:hypothetical protein